MAGFRLRFLGKSLPEARPTRTAWRPTLLRVAEVRRFDSWLTEPGSLTARLQRGAADFRVEVVRQRALLPFEDEWRLLGLGRPERVRVREVILRRDGEAAIYAHTVLALGSRGVLTRWFGRLGSRSLGSLLFANPAFCRTPLEFRRLDRRHPLLRRAEAVLPAPPGSCWARRALYRLGNQRLLVTEVFLPPLGREVR